jgi:hypothetical protein
MLILAISITKESKSSNRYKLAASDELEWSAGQSSGIFMRLKVGVNNRTVFNNIGPIMPRSEVMWPWKLRRCCMLTWVLGDCFGIAANRFFDFRVYWNFLLFREGSNLSLGVKQFFPVEIFILMESNYSILRCNRKCKALTFIKNFLDSTVYTRLTVICQSWRNIFSDIINLLAYSLKLKFWMKIKKIKKKLLRLISDLKNFTCFR